MNDMWSPTEPLREISGRFKTSALIGMSGQPQLMSLIWETHDSLEAMCLPIREEMESRF
jgi:hypothetical protein